MKDIRYLTAGPGGAYGLFSDVSFVASEGGNVDLAVVDEEERLKQDVAKIMLTELGTAPYPNYGAGLANYIYRKFNSIDVLDNVQKDILTALYYLIFREPSTNPAERIGRIDDISVSYADQAITSEISITTEKGTGVNLEAVI